MDESKVMVSISVIHILPPLEITKAEGKFFKTYHWQHDQIQELQQPKQN